MKNCVSFLYVLVLIALVSCQTEKKAEPVDKDAVKTEVANFMDELYSVFTTKNFDLYANRLCDDGLFVGTDRTEFMDKSALIEAQKSMFDDPEFVFTYKLTKRVVRVANDGKSALVIDQFEDTPVFGPDMPVRLTSQVIKTENGWKVDYMGWGLIPDNEDLGKIAAALAE